jgi:hypothetical protein
LTYIRPEGQDTTFSWDDLMTKNNSELLNNLGNFVNRALAFCEKNLGGVVPNISNLTHDDAKIMAKINQELADYKENLDKIKLRDGRIFSPKFLIRIKVIYLELIDCSKCFKFFSETILKIIRSYI